MNVHVPFKSNIRDFILLVLGVFLGILGNFLVEYVMMANPPSHMELPALIGLILFLLGFYFIAGLYLLSKFS